MRAQTVKFLLLCNSAISFAAQQIYHRLHPCKAKRIAELWKEQGLTAQTSQALVPAERAAEVVGAAATA
jgi:hypothetical protein